MQSEYQRRRAMQAAQWAYDNAEPEPLPEDDDEQAEQDDPEHWLP